MMAVLYWASSMPGVPDAGDPGAGAAFRWLPPAVQNAVHIPAFAALSSAWRWALAAWMRTARARTGCSFALAAGYGVLDEWHQSFVPGRFASLTDVALDVAGAFVGVWIAARLGKPER